MTIWLVHIRAEVDVSERQRCAHPKEARLLSCFASMTSTTLGRSTIRRYAFRSTIGKLGLPARLERCFATRWLNFQGDGGTSPVGAAFGLCPMSKSSYRRPLGFRALLCIFVDHPRERLRDAHMQRRPGCLCSVIRSDWMCTHDPSLQQPYRELYKGSTQSIE